MNALDENLAKLHFRASTPQLSQTDTTAIVHSWASQSHFGFCFMSLGMPKHPWSKEKDYAASQVSSV
jgi:hypothetical protein